jgi:hypothetical protein
MRFYWIVGPLLSLLAGCASEEYGQCDAPDDYLKVMFKDSSSASPFSHSFCIVCNPNIEPAEYGAWALQMGAPEAPELTEGLHPCLYVYGGPPGTDNTESFESCRSLVCDGGATFSDMVGKGNGNFDLQPILN